MPSEFSTDGADQQLGRAVEELKRDLERKTRELAEAREQQAATAGVLAAISSTPTDLQRVFADVATSAARLCDAYDATIFLADGDLLRRVANHGSIPQDDTLPLTREVVTGRALLAGRAIHVTDVQAETGEYPEGSQRARRVGHRTILAVPLIRAGNAIGVISIRRTEVRAFTDRQVELLKTFADQAVIAIENTRLFEAEQASKRELQEALEYQTATSEVLSIISRAPNELQQVLTAVAESAARVCGASETTVFRLEEDEIHLAASFGKLSTTSPFTPGGIGSVLPLTRGSVSGRAIIDRRTIHVADLAAEIATEFPDAAAAQTAKGHRTTLGAPLLRDGQAIGAIVMLRLEVAPFSEKQIKLLETFADQAVIAIENTRLFEAEQASKRGLQESLEYQTATSEVLNVISRSPTELQPVLDAIAATAARLCESMDAVVWRVVDGRVGVVAQFGAPTNGSALPLTRGSVTGRAIVDRKTIHVHDLAAMVETEYPEVKERQQRIGHRTTLATPLLSQGEALGAISVRRNHVHPFSDRQIALLKTFADQVVIAIENARLFEAEQTRTKELTESLEYQTATSEVLAVISRSPNALQPVVDSISETAVRLCGADWAFIRTLGPDGQYHAVSFEGVPGKFVDLMLSRTLTPGRSLIAGRALLERRTIHVDDVFTDPDCSEEQLEIARAGQFHTVLAVPLLRAGEPIGVIVLLRTNVAPFSKRQIDLVSTFADQAVIAINNVGLFEEVQARTKELQESLEYQTATSEVLSVISRSPDKLQPVLDEIAVTSARLCDAEFSMLFRVEADLLPLVANNKSDAAFVQYCIDHPVPYARNSNTGRAAVEGHTIHTADVRADPENTREEATRLGGQRTVLSVPLLGDGRAVGVITLMRSEVKPFTQRQIALVETFADQAVIAINNVGLFEEVQARTRELQESLKYQTATSDVLGVISRSPNQLQPVLDAIVETAFGLCPSDGATIMLREADCYRFVASAGYTRDEIRDRTQQHPVPVDRGSVVGRVAVEGRTIHVQDVKSDPEYTFWPSVARRDRRTVLGVPLVRDGSIAGVIILFRTRVEPYNQRQIELVETFADQAVIAMNNARLFEEVQARTGELQESLEYQTATSDVLNVISRSKFDLQPVLNSIVETAARLCACDMATIRRREGDIYVQLAGYGLPDDYAEYSRSASWHHAGRGSLVGRVLQEGKAVQIPDVLADPDYTLNEAQRRGGFRSTLGVPLLRGADQIGIIVLMRRVVQPFSNKQIELVTAFADQAVIAIENTRLFEEVQARTRELSEALEQQTATSEVLGVISSSAGELEPVFRAMLANAVRICGAKFGTMHLYSKGTFCSVATHNVPPAFAEFRRKNPVTPGPATGLVRAVRSRQPVQIPDLTKSDTYRDGEPASVQLADLAGARTLLVVPMVKEGQALGTISIYRQEVRPFTDKQAELLTSFASQAVIAIENTRLLTELRESLQQQTATADVLKVISRAAFDLPKVLDTLVESAASICDSYDTAILQKDGDVLRIVSHRGHIPSIGQVGEATLSLTREATVGRAVLDRQTIHLPDLQSETDEYPEGSAIARRLGFRTILTVPLLAADEAVGAITLRRSEVRPFSDRQIELLQTFADQAVIAIENTRLLEEITRKSRELEIASQHKSQFVANMSHELRTPLAAILGYAELMQEGFYEPQGKKSLDALTRIRSNGKHLLGLINTVLDIAKIESGQFNLNLAEYAVENVVETVRAATESLAETKKLALKTEVAKRLPVGMGDEQRLTQVLLNLVGNAIKFTDTGEVRITATATDGHFTVSVTDTGPGIPQEHQARVFEQFHQIDNSNTKAKGGTGLGLAIAKQIVEMHGGRIWVESTLGQGATFQMQLPIRAESRKILA